MKRLRRWIGSVDWVMLALIAGFLFVVPLPSLPAGALGGLIKTVRPNSFAAYEAALREAAIKTPADKTALATIDSAQAEIEVGTFAGLYRPLAIGPLTLNTEMWVFLPDQLGKACKGESDATFAIRQILGLPPGYDERIIYRIAAKPDDMFRPCMSGSGLSSPTCEFSAPPRLDSTSLEAGTSPEQLRDLLKAYDQLWFMVNHISSTYRTGFPRKYAGPDDYPFDGYPFTGMGWTYDWRPSRQSHVGVSEFVIRKGAAVAVKSTVTPADFCTP